MENKGVEISLSTRNITTKNFSWYTNFNFAYNGNKVLQENIPEQQTTPGREGYPVGAIFALKTAGVNKETGNMMFYNPEGEKVTLKGALPPEGRVGDRYCLFRCNCSRRENLLFVYRE